MKELVQAGTIEGVPRREHWRRGSRSGWATSESAQRSHRGRRGARARLADGRQGRCYSATVEALATRVGDGAISRVALPADGFRRPRPIRQDDRLCASAQSLVMATLATSGDSSARVLSSGYGRIEIVWDCPSQLTWIVDRPASLWPAANVRVYHRTALDSPALTSRSFGLAHRVVEHAKTWLAWNG